MGPFDEQPVPKAPDENLWTFVYKKGPAPMTGCVRATSEDLAYRIACKWCEVQKFRSPAKVFAFIVADESIFALYSKDAPRDMAAFPAAPQVPQKQRDPALVR